MTNPRVKFLPRGNLIGGSGSRSLLFLHDAVVARQGTAKRLSNSLCRFALSIHAGKPMRGESHERGKTSQARGKYV